MSAPTPRCVSAASAERNLDAAVGEVLEDLEGAFGGAAPDLLFVFATHHYGEGLPRLGAELVEGTGAAGLVGCTGAWAIGTGKELEASAGLTVLAATLPGTRIAQVRIAPPADGGAEALEFPLPAPDDSSVFLFGDPFSFPASAWLRAYGESPSSVAPLVGGLAAGGTAPGQNVLWMGAEPYTDGAVALVLEGATRAVPIVSQGCRPVGPPLVVTKLGGGAVLELGGRPAAEALFGALAALDEGERALFEAGAFVGRAVDAARSEDRPGELIVRPVLGVDPRSRGVHIADEGLRRGVTLRLMVRDPQTASNEFASILSDAGLEATGEAFGGLLFTCSGRGRSMFGRENPDADAVESTFGPGFPLAGFAASGEIGPVGHTPFLHGFTASGALLAPR